MLLAMLGLEIGLVFYPLPFTRPGRYAPKSVVRLNWIAGVVFFFWAKRLLLLYISSFSSFLLTVTWIGHVLTAT
jgi:hypothetical protein